MFTFTKMIFFMLLDMMVSALLIGAAIVILAFILFIVIGIIKALIVSLKTNKTDTK